MPKTAILLGSDSDLPLMKDCFKTLESLGIDFQVELLSAHRMPEYVSAFALEAEKKGFELIIAGAGLAAHLPGVVAAYTVLPVIGVPLKSKSLDGLDALLSIVQMPPGIPVATVGINNSKNAALLAAAILSLKHPELREKLRRSRESNKKALLSRNEQLKKSGWEKYLRKNWRKT
ncbi:MAG: 5-(carboxyamino)imidazole ribonucleotide mutase [Elusimicrobia bacterium CG08_land_8_20_14_0_20_51_18]|nr:MAG: 5-(carboxyamino)imidazole ribonucleotide mutase [Elusimicrobia bacterium CG08_land_8_20_14_0_20_51_18]